MSKTLAPPLILLHGTSIPRVGLGTWPLVGGEAQRMVSDALDRGYRLFDTSHKYANEDAVGAAIRASRVDRESIFVTSKLNKEDHGVERVASAYEASLRRMGLDYLDLFLIHWPVPWLGSYPAAWEGLVRLISEGRVGAIGVSNFKPHHIERIVEATGYVPDVNQIQLSADLARLTPREYHSSHGILTQAWSPLGRGSQVRDDPRVIEIARAVQRSPAQVLLRWHIQHGIVPVPRASNTTELDENIALFDFRLNASQMSTLSLLDRGEDAARDSDSLENGH